MNQQSRYACTNLVGPLSILVSTSVHSAVRWRLPIDIGAYRKGGSPDSETSAGRAANERLSFSVKPTFHSLIRRDVAAKRARDGARGTICVSWRSSTGEELLIMCAVLKPPPVAGRTE